MMLPKYGNTIRSHFSSSEKHLEPRNPIIDRSPGTTERMPWGGNKWRFLRTGAWLTSGHHMKTSTWEEKTKNVTHLCLQNHSWAPEVSQRKQVKDLQVSQSKYTQEIRRSSWTRTMRTGNASKRGKERIPEDGQAAMIVATEISPHNRASSARSS